MFEKQKKQKKKIIKIDWVFVQSMQVWTAEPSQNGLAWRTFENVLLNLHLHIQNSYSDLTNCFGIYINVCTLFDR